MPPYQALSPMSASTMTMAEQGVALTILLQLATPSADESCRRDYRLDSLGYMLDSLESSLDSSASMLDSLDCDQASTSFSCNTRTRAGMAPACR